MDPLCERYSSFFHERGLKNTRSRSWVLHVLMHHDGVMTAEEIYQVLAGHGEDVNLSTVYRVLDLLTQRGIIEKSSLPGSACCVFALRRQDHSHHLICLGCHKIVALRHCPLHDFETSVEASTGFTVVGHSLQLFGYCEECRKKLEEEKK